VRGKCEDVGMAPIFLRAGPSRKASTYQVKRHPLENGADL
jgi:hypothetical protein